MIPCAPASDTSRAAKIWQLWSWSFTFGALLNAFGMVSPVYAVENWLGHLLHVSHESPVLGIIFTTFLVIEPILLLGFASWLTVRTGGSNRALPLAVRYSYALVPLGFGMWVAHYGFHFLTGLWTFIPVTQSALSPWLGTPLWTLRGVPAPVVQVIEIGFLLLGLAGSLVITHSLAEEDAPQNPMRAFIPWASVCLIIWGASMWLMFQPMEMRATMMMTG